MGKVHISRYSTGVAVAVAALAHCALSIALFPDYNARAINAPHDAWAADMYWVLNLPLAWTAAFWGFLTLVLGTALALDPKTADLSWVPPLLMSLVQIGVIYLLARVIRTRRGSPAVEPSQSSASTSSG